MDSNNKKQYQVAIAYNQFLHTRNSALKPSTPLPSCIHEELHSTRCISENKPENIFIYNSELRQRKLDLQPLKGYEYVGIKDIRTYLTRTDKKKRNMNSTVKRSTQSALSFSRVSQIKAQERYLTKQQVITMFAPSKHKQIASMLDETYLSNELTVDLKKVMSTQNTTFGSSAQTPHMLTESLNLSHTFSMNKLLSKMNGYRRDWDKQLRVKKKDGLHNRYKTMKLDSILKNSEQFRTKMQNMQKNTIIEKNNNLPPSWWKVMLRDQADLRRTNEVEKVIKVGFMNSGRSKFKKQLSWIQQKDKQGHFFKLRKNEKQNAPR